MTCRASGPCPHHPLILKRGNIKYRERAVGVVLEYSDVHCRRGGKEEGGAERAEEETQDLLSPPPKRLPRRRRHRRTARFFSVDFVTPAVSDWS